VGAVVHTVVVEVVAPTAAVAVTVAEVVGITN
jgi:hypothetical protein